MADELQLEIHPTLKHISGYVAGTTLANGLTHVTLTVDLVTAVVRVYVVANEVQTVPIIVGQSF
jgi:hypothetical protein